MFRRVPIFISLTFLFAFLLSVPPVLAQGKKKSVVGEPIEITILSVVKNDAGAKPDPSGRGRLVPVSIQWKTGPWNGAQLVSLEANLITGNTDGSTTEVKKPLAVKATGDTLTLPMPQGVFAKTFVLTLTSQSSLTDAFGAKRVVTSQASQRGDFPVPAENK
jgi:hypothetical protein